MGVYSSPNTSSCIHEISTAFCMSHLNEVVKMSLLLIYWMCNNVPNVLQDVFSILKKILLRRSGWEL